VYGIPAFPHSAKGSIDNRKYHHSTQFIPTLFMIGEFPMGWSASSFGIPVWVEFLSIAVKQIGWLAIGSARFANVVY